MALFNRATYKDQRIHNDTRRYSEIRGEITSEREGRGSVLVQPQSGNEVNT